MRDDIREANVVMAKCKHSNSPYGIRIERRGSVWYCTWAFKISEKKASNEGYTNNRISGEVDFDEEYPGCPYCGRNKWVICGHCGRLNCWGEQDREFTCAWCGVSSEVKITNRFELQGGGF